jgi:hypothetical protein
MGERLNLLRLKNNLANKQESVPAHGKTAMQDDPATQ